MNVRAVHIRETQNRRAGLFSFILRLAQLVERAIRNRKVTGSTPVPGSSLPIPSITSTNERWR